MHIVEPMHCNGGLLCTPLRALSPNAPVFILQCSKLLVVTTLPYNAHSTITALSQNALCNAQDYSRHCSATASVSVAIDKVFTAHCGVQQSLTTERVRFWLISDSNHSGNQHCTVGRSYRSPRPGCKSSLKFCPDLKHSLMKLWQRWDLQMPCAQGPNVERKAKCVW